MRDLLLLSLLPFLIFYAIKRPFIGLALWLWTSLVPMQTWAYGMATSIRWNLIFAACTILGYALMKNKPKVQFGGLFFAMFCLLLLATLSSILHQGYGVLVWDRWERFFKAYIFFIFVYLIVDKKLHVEALMWACVLSVTAAAATQGFKVIFSGGGHIVYGISTTFNDNNLSAFATLVSIPLTLYLIEQYKHQFVIKMGLIGAIGVSAIFVLGSDSRGGLIGLLVLAGYYFMQSKKKVPMIIISILVAGIGLSLMDQSWFDRMGTITEANEDSSFMGRVIAWKFGILMALKSPLWGGGFDAIAYKPTWQALMSHWSLLSFIPTSYPSKGHVAHSIYFQVLGDLGFVGFFLYFGIIYKVHKTFKQIKQSSNTQFWGVDVANYCALTVICFLVSGAALSVAYNEITIMLIGLSGGLLRIYRQQLPPTVPKRNVYA